MNPLVMAAMSAGGGGQGLADLRALAPALAAAAQREIDAWEQDEGGWDEVLGTGGCCGLVAGAMSEVLSDAGFECAQIGTDLDGGHEFVVALCDAGPVMVDVPARVYETGGGYVWSKRPDVIVAPDDVTMDLLGPPMTAEAFAFEYADGPAPRPEP